MKSKYAVKNSVLPINCINVRYHFERSICHLSSLTYCLFFFCYSATLMDRIGNLSRENEKLQNDYKQLEKRLRTVADKNDNGWINATLDMAKWVFTNSGSSSA